MADQLRCPYSIRWGTGEVSTTRCDKPEHPEDMQHEGPGLAEFPGQRIHWQAGDRREYSGEWPGYCSRIPAPAFGGGCTLPSGHWGRCAP